MKGSYWNVINGHPQFGLLSSIYGFWLPLSLVSSNSSNMRRWIRGYSSPLFHLISFKFLQPLVSFLSFIFSFLHPHSIRSFLLFLFSPIFSFLTPLPPFSHHSSSSHHFFPLSLYPVLLYVVKHAHAVTSFKQSPVWKCHIFPCLVIENFIWI